MLRRPVTRRGAEAGLTLVEVLVSMIILSIITTGLITAWVNLQRGANFAVAANNSRATARDAISRISSELRAAQPTALPTSCRQRRPRCRPVSLPSRWRCQTR